MHNSRIISIIVHEQLNIWPSRNNQIFTLDPRALHYKWNHSTLLSCLYITIFSRLELQDNEYNSQNNEHNSLKSGIWAHSNPCSLHSWISQSLNKFHTLWIAISCYRILQFSKNIHRMCKSQVGICCAVNLSILRQSVNVRWRQKLKNVSFFFLFARRGCGARKSIISKDTGKRET